MGVGRAQEYGRCLPSPHPLSSSALKDSTALRPTESIFKLHMQMERSVGSNEATEWSFREKLFSPSSPTSHPSCWTVAVVSAAPSHVLCRCRTNMRRSQSDMTHRGVTDHFSREIPPTDDNVTVTQRWKSEDFQAATTTTSMRLFRWQVARAELCPGPALPQR